MKQQDTDPLDPAQTLTVNRRTGLKDAHLAEGTLADPVSNEEIEVTHVVMHSVTFRSGVPLSPGTIRYLRAGNNTARLASGVRVVSSRLRSDGLFDIKAEFF
ncbi:MAG TPA: hypothetical protein PKB10_01680 [Tepidisphaeraceae bacterium]|mgnify:CR=1 FL=1|nr:hypothetical protein [Tepidisphaeraceae bacterium]